MTKSEVIEQLKSAENFPDLVRLQNLEVLEWIDLKFKDDNLDKIEFKVPAGHAPYTNRYGQ